MIKIQPLNDIEIDIWRNKVGSYYQFKADQTPLNEKNTPTLQISEENDELPTSLRSRKGVDYTPMLTSDLDSEVETDRKSQKIIDHMQVDHLHSDSKQTNIPDCPKQITP